MSMKPGQFQIGRFQDGLYRPQGLSPIDGQPEFTVFLAGLDIDMGMGFNPGRQAQQDPLAFSGPAQ